MIERQELYCHECDKYVQFNLDMSLNGNHVLKCPNCEHEHCRVVKDGKITSDRWDQRNGAAIYVATSTISSTSTSTWNTYNYGSGSSYSSSTSYRQWMNSSAVTAV
ncbi:hypothetical protein LCGC14_2789980 [marine sediment metagenome]|uniref:Uncharacterized protein n=1 Tax=marine sediment metagenome TaxID=412755 RepID=A0A0F9AZG0_9ZZZZ